MGFGIGTPRLDLGKINSDMDPSTPNVFDIGSKVGAEWRNARIGGNLIVGGDLTVQGLTTTIESQTLTVVDKNIELAAVASPSDALADGGGFILKGTTDKTILWNSATGCWKLNQDICIDDLSVNRSFRISDSLGNVDAVITRQTVTNDVFMGDVDANGGDLHLRANGVDRLVIDATTGIVSVNTSLSIGSTPAISGALRLTNADSIVSRNNANNGDIVLLASAFLNSRDVVVLGNATDDLQIPNGNPGVNKVLTSDATGIATWEVVSAGGGWVDDGTVVRLATGSDSVGIGTSTPQAPLQVSGVGGVTVGGFASGAFHVTSTLADVNANAVITGHNLFGGNKQLWYLGSVASGNDNIAFINRQTGSLSLQTSGNGDILLTPNGTGKVVITSALSGLTQLTVDNIDINGNTISVTNIDGDLILDAMAAGTGVVKVTDQLEIEGTTSQLLLTDTDNAKTYIVKNNTGDFQITEVGGNNSFKILGGAAVNSFKITANQVEIATRLHVDNLRLDANTISSLDTNGNINLSPNGTGSLAVSTTAIIGSTSVNPDGTLHVHTGSSGAVTASSVANALVVEDSTNNGISILTPAASSGRIIFGSPADPFGAFLAWSDSVNDFAIGSSKIGANFRLTSDQETTNLTLSGGSGSELATFTKDVTITGQIKITGGTPGNSKVLRSDANGLATWGDIGWTDLGTDVVLLDGGNNVGIGTATPDTKLHVQADGGSAGVVTAFAGTIATLESSGNGFLSILTPDASIRGILFGEPSSNIAGGIFYNDPGSVDGFQFRVNGNVTKMVIEGDGKVGIGTTNPDITALLDITSTTLGFLPPRMTSTQVGAIVSPATGLIVYDTDIDKLKLATPTAFQNLLSEDLGQVVAQDSFVSNNVRYFGELGLPGSQVGWTESGTGVISIEVGDNVFGVIKNTIKHFSTTGNSTKSESPITAADWVNILTFGASFSGITRITEDISTNGMFAGVGFSPANDPRASSIESRAGMFISVNATHTTITLDGTATVILDGTGGNPLVLKDEWFTWEAVINPTPDAGVSFGVVDVFVNNVLIVTGAINSSNNAVSDEISLANSSSSGQTTFYADNFGITIYEESATKTLSATLMSADVAQITIPEGRRDYTIILPDGNPRNIGAVLRMVANNLFGKVTLANQNPAAPEILYNGLRTFVFNVNIKEIVDGINTIDQANVYLGFQTSDIDRAKSIFIQLSSSVNQDPADTNPTVITYNTNDGGAGLTHSTTVNSGEVTAVTEGVYFISPQPQVGKTSGATKTDFDIFLQVDRGSGFVDEPNTNIKLTIKDSDITDVAVSALGISLNVGDKIRLMQRVSSSSVGMGLKATAAETGPPTVPATPAIILDMHRIGGLAV